MDAKRTKEFVQNYAKKLGQGLKVLRMRTRPLIKRGYLEIPKIEVGEGKDKTKKIFLQDVVVGLWNENSVALPWVMMVKESSRYDVEIYLETPRVNCERVSGKSIMGLLCLEAYRNSLVDITFLGENPEEIKKAAFRIYSGITTLGDRPDFERLDKYLRPVSSSNR